MKAESHPSPAAASGAGCVLSRERAGTVSWARLGGDSASSHFPPLRTLSCFQFASPLMTLIEHVFNIYCPLGYLLWGST